MKLGFEERRAMQSFKNFFTFAELRPSFAFELLRKITRESKEAYPLPMVVAFALGKIYGVLLSREVGPITSLHLVTEANKGLGALVPEEYFGEKRIYGKTGVPAPPKEPA